MVCDFTTSWLKMAGSLTVTGTDFGPTQVRFDSELNEEIRLYQVDGRVVAMTNFVFEAMKL